MNKREEGKSAKTINRPQLQQLLADTRLKDFGVVIVYSFSRLARKTADHKQLRHEIHGRGIDLRSLEGP